MKAFTQKITLLSLALMLLGHWAMAQTTYTTTQSGDWSDPVTWGGTAPTMADYAVIASGHTVTLTADATAARLTFSSNGSLDIGTHILTITDELDLGFGSSFSGSVNSITTTGTGKLRFTGGTLSGPDRIMASLWHLEIDRGGILNVTDDLVCGSLTVKSGTTLNLSAGKSILLPHASYDVPTTTHTYHANGTQGVVTVESGATLKADQVGRFADRFGSAASAPNGTGHFIQSITIAGTLELHDSGSGSNGALNATDVTIDGTLILADGSGILESKGGTTAFSYGANATLEYRIPGSFGDEINRGGSLDIPVTIPAKVIIDIPAPAIGNINKLNVRYEDLTINKSFELKSGLVDMNISSTKMTFNTLPTITGTPGVERCFAWQTNFLNFTPAFPLTSDKGLRVGIAQNASFTFPVGIFTTVSSEFSYLTYNPITITNKDAAETFSVALDNAVTTPADVSKIANVEWWITTADGTGNIDVEMDFTGVTAGGSFDIATASLYKLTGTTWEPLLNPSAAGNILSGSWNGPLSPFAGGGGGALPVELLSFTAEAKGAANVLHWETASELENKGFEVEHSTDGRSFRQIGFVEGRGTTSEQQTYRFTHEAASAQSYYRLRQVDFDGQYEYSAVVLVGRDTRKQTTIFPNPGSLQSAYLGLELLSDTRVEVEILDVTGRQVAVFRQDLEAGQHELPLHTHLAQSGTGLYYVKVTTGSVVSSHVLSIR